MDVSYSSTTIMYSSARKYFEVVLYSIMLNIYKY